MRLVVKLITAGVVFCFLVTAQHTSSEISGSVKDPNGAAVSHATVTVRNRETGVVREVTTNDEGAFRVDVPPGNYDLTVTIPGFKSYVESNIIASVGKAKALNIIVRFGAVSETVDISGGYPSVELTWNAWAEPASPSPSFAPVKYLEPGDKNYSLVLDLSAFAYSNDPSVYSRGVGAKIKEWLLKSKAPDTDITLVIIPDEKYFYALPVNERVKTIRVDLKRLRKALKKGVKARDEPLKILKNQPQVDFSFGRVSINLRTRQEQGTGAVAITFWADGVMPVDEMSLPLCLAQDAKAAERCDENDAIHESLSGIDPIRAAAQQRTSAMKPDAALNFIELNSSTTVGVFRDNAWPENKYVHWTLPSNADRIRDYLQLTLLPRFDRSVDDSALIQLGSELFSLLLPQGTDGRQAFSEFVRSRSQNEDPSNPPSIFIRLLSSKSDDPPFLIPLGLIAYETGEGKKDFLGFQFRIQTPLQLQDYRPYSKCISSWIVLAPPEAAGESSDALDVARNQFADWYEKWEFEEINDIPPFGKWIGTYAEEKNPLALFILAHQDSNSLYFSDRESVGAYGIDRRFKTPSVALVNGCATGAPGTSAIVQRLNANGVSTVVATAARVEGRLAGDFFSVLGQILSDNPKEKELPLGLAYFRALRELRGMTPPHSNAPYGAKVLAYELLGDSSLRVCSPKKRKNLTSVARSN